MTTLDIIFGALRQALARADELERAAEAREKEFCAAINETIAARNNMAKANGRIAEIEDDAAALRLSLDASQKRAAELEERLRIANGRVNDQDAWSERPPHATHATRCSTDTLREQLMGFGDACARADDADAAHNIENIVGPGLRHRPSVHPLDYLHHWLAVGRCFGYARGDDSWGELEKLFSIIVKRMLIAEARLRKSQSAKLDQSEQQ